LRPRRSTWGERDNDAAPEAIIAIDTGDGTYLFDRATCC